MSPVEVQTAKSYWVRMGCLGAVFVPIYLMFIFIAVVNVGSYKFSVSGLPMLLVLFAMLASPPILLWRARRAWAHRIDEHGITLRSGASFRWQDFQNVQTVLQRDSTGNSHGVVNHYDIVFRTGSARIYPQVTENAEQVTAIVRSLQRGENPFSMPGRI